MQRLITLFSQSGAERSGAVALAAAQRGRRNYLGRARQYAPEWKDHVFHYGTIFALVGREANRPRESYYASENTRVYDVVDLAGISPLEFSPSLCATQNSFDRNFLSYTSELEIPTEKKIDTKKFYLT